MGKRVQTTDARNALGGIIRRQVKGATKNNDLVSRKEAEKLGPFARRAEAEVRAAKPPRARVRTYEIVDRAMHNAMAVWHAFNPPGAGQDSRYLSKAEIRQIEKADPELGALTRSAYVAVRGASDTDKLAAVRAFFEGNPGIGALLRGSSSFGTSVDARVGQPDRADVPAAVLEAFDVFHRAEAADWATASLKWVQIAGQELYTLHLGTDGDDGLLEVFSAAGQPLASGRMSADDLQRWDPFFGLGRFTGALGKAGHPVTDGYSEDDERLTAGQILSTWKPDVVLSAGQMLHDPISVYDIDTPVALDAGQREVALAALDLMFERSFTHVLSSPSDPLHLGSTGSLRIGTHVHPQTAEQYIVADWRDIDDASFTFYFQREPSGALRLAIEQYNN